MPSHGRGSYRAAKAAAKVLNEEKSQMDRDIAAWQAEIDRLRAELAESKASARATQVCADRDWNRAKQAEARLAAVIAVCRQAEDIDGEDAVWTYPVRAAATGDTK